MRNQDSARGHFGTKGAGIARAERGPEDVRMSGETGEKSAVSPAPPLLTLCRYGTSPEEVTLSFVPRAFCMTGTRVVLRVSA
ncbi:hypothetical protein NHX12_002678 [Muraenolepis orangiensis]|uniref:Uncharacterized protein n=1 Tax=Muraenolepis orangiensis TaxID=630683 RepID=A0A9Q0DUY2_9TELE|nr:hypothetical protein NHX12_002678 [Muraenolepis orangiensis]